MARCKRTLNFHCHSVAFEPFHGASVPLGNWTPAGCCHLYVVVCPCGLVTSLSPFLQCYAVFLKSCFYKITRTNTGCLHASVLPFGPLRAHFLKFNLFIIYSCKSVIKVFLKILLPLAFVWSRQSVDFTQR